MKKTFSIICTIVLLSVFIAGFAEEESWICSACETVNTQSFCMRRISRMNSGGICWKNISWVLFPIRLRKSA